MPPISHSSKRKSGLVFLIDLCPCRQRDPASIAKRCNRASLNLQNVSYGHWIGWAGIIRRHRYCCITGAEWLGCSGWDDHREGGIFRTTLPQECSSGLGGQAVSNPASSCWSVFTDWRHAGQGLALRARRHQRGSARCSMASCPADTRRWCDPGPNTADARWC